MNNKETKPRYTTSQWIKLAQRQHGIIYDYSRVDYMGASVDITIGCEIHGDFSLRPSNHLQGRGCPLCAGGVSRKKSSREQFIERANKVHDNKYDYKAVKYRNAITNVSIICPTHGTFQKTPSNHLAGQGCLKCKNKGK